jgi:predicted lysophospholipase L1 biosynthesis ABC-type transport system permease subunit
MLTLWQDVRYALRMIARDPSFAAILVLTIGLGIGASTAVFSVANALLFRRDHPAPALARDVLLWMGTAVAISLLIACVNCTNLLIARGMMRRKELAVRAAMGAGRLRVFRLMLTESVVLSLLGGVAGVLLAWWGDDLLIALAPGLKTGVDARVLGFTLAISILSGILFGMAPALDSIRSDGHELLKRSDNGAEPPMQLLRGANLVVIGEVALAISLMIGAGVLLHFPPMLPSALLATFAGITLLLAMSGVYAVTCQMVGRRTREFSIRLALGATRNEVLRIVAGEAMLLVAIGSAVGIVTGMFAARALPDVRTADLTTILAVSLILAAAAAPASYFPARAASKIEPRTALKSD